MTQYFFSLLFAGCLVCSGFFSPPAAAVSSLPAALPGLSSFFAGSAPDIGVRNGQLTPCPDSPNCVVSQGADLDHEIDPIRYQSDRDTAQAALLKVLTVVPNTTVVEQRDDYIRTESASKLLGFIDDGEFYFPAEDNVIQVRSAARLGESDLGVNRRRLEQIRLALADLGV
ncbi:MAG: DUF1499 domain-containing protein [Thermosynechococcaceae cyanobacterium]